MRTCEDCQKRDKCREPCEWLEGELAQVTVEQRECVSEHIVEHGNVPCFKSELPTDMLSLHLVVMQLHEDGLSSRNISYHMGYEFSYVCRVVDKYLTSSAVQDEISARDEMLASQIKTPA